MSAKILVTAEYKKYHSDPFFTSMWKQNLTAPTGFFAVDRSSIDEGFSKAGTITFGTMPDIEFLTPMVMTKLIASNDTNAPQQDAAIPADPGFHKITVDHVF